MTTRSVVIAGKSIACPQHHHRGTLGQDILRSVTQVLAAEISFGGLLPGVVLAGVILTPQFVVRFDPGDLHLDVVVQGRNLGAALRDGGGQQSQ